MKIPADFQINTQYPKSWPSHPISNCYGSELMASLDLTLAFDVVNIGLLLESIRIIGLPPDVITMIGVGLTGQYFYVILVSSNSFFSWRKCWESPGFFPGTKPLLTFHVTPA